MMASGFFYQRNDLAFLFALVRPRSPLSLVSVFHSSLILNLFACRFVDRRLTYLYFEPLFVYPSFLFSSSIDRTALCTRVTAAVNPDCLSIRWNGMMGWSLGAARVVVDVAVALLLASFLAFLHSFLRFFEHPFSRFNVGLFERIDSQ